MSLDLYDILRQQDACKNGLLAEAFVARGHAGALLLEKARTNRCIFGQRKAEKGQEYRECYDRHRSFLALFKDSC